MYKEKRMIVSWVRQVIDMSKTMSGYECILGFAERFNAVQKSGSNQ